MRGGEEEKKKIIIKQTTWMVFIRKHLLNHVFSGTKLPLSVARYSAFPRFLCPFTFAIVCALSVCCCVYMMRRSVYMLCVSRFLYIPALNEIVFLFSVSLSLFSFISFLVAEQSQTQQMCVCVSTEHCCVVCALGSVRC